MKKKQITNNNHSPNGNVQSSGKSFWKTNRNTIIGSIIGGAVSLAVFCLKKLVSTAVKDKEREKDIKAHKQQVDYDNAQALQLFQDKMRLQGTYGYQSSLGSGTFAPLKPKLYDPLNDKANATFKDSRLFASAIHSGDCGIIAAPKGVGKTILFMQIGCAIAEGKPTGLWPQYAEGVRKPQIVEYYDGELNDKDMFDRYYKFNFEFPENFNRYDRTQLHSVEDILNDLECKVPTYQSDTTVIIDNITKFLDTAQIDKVNRFNARLERIHSDAKSRGINLTIILIIHVLGKSYTEGKPIKLKDIAGASNTTNFQNFVIALEKPLGQQGPLGVRVLNSRGEPEPDTVCLLQPCQDSWAHFEFDSEISADESPKNAKAPLTKQERDLAEARQIKKFLDAGHTQEEAAAQFGCVRQTIANRLKLLNP